VRLAACGVFLAVFFSAGCGYVGPVLPPSAEIPATIADLAAVERGDQIIITFTAPPRTVDGVAIKEFSVIDLRVAGKAYDVELPSPSDREDPQAKPVTRAVPVSDWSGQKVAVMVRTAVKKKGHFSAWSNSVLLEVNPPLEIPVVRAESSASGIVLTWNAGDGVQYRVQRQGPADKQLVELATVDAGEYVDSSAQYDTAYRYIVTAKKGTAESLPSEAISKTAIDKFPPAVPSGLTVLAGPDAVDLAWQRDTETDLQGYYVYRSVNNGAFERLGELVTLPTYADQKVERGKTYSYKVSAIDKKGNESAQCSASEVQY
jgi:hypothetical protein